VEALAGLLDTESLIKLFKPKVKPEPELNEELAIALSPVVEHVLLG